jgi:hypothetical protein
MAAVEILKLALPGFPFSKSLVQYSARAEDKLAGAALRARPNCLYQSGRDRDLHLRMIMGTKFAGLSTPGRRD